MDIEKVWLGWLKRCVEATQNDSNSFKNKDFFQKIFNFMAALGGFLTYV